MDALIITGASGQLARRAAEHVLATAAPPRLILVTRSPAALDDLAQRGADVREGDFDDPHGLARAFAGGERMLLVSATDLDRRKGQHRAAIGTAAAAGVAHVVYTSVVCPGARNPAVVAESHADTEHALRESGLAWTFLRNSLYAEYQVAEAIHCLQTGALVHNREDGRVAYVSREDCAAAAAGVLATTGHEDVAYDVTGPAPLSAADLASLYAELGGSPVEEVRVDDEQLVAQLAGPGSADDHLVYGARLVASFGQAIRQGCLSSCSGAVAELTGRRPRTLRAVLEDRLDELRSAGARSG